MSAGAEEYKRDFSHKETEREYSCEGLSSPAGEFYSVDTDQNPGLKEKITNVHGADSRQVSFIRELEDFLSDSDKYNQASKKFKAFVRSHLKIPHNTDYLIDEFINSGYITTLERLRAPNSQSDLEFYSNYAANHGMTLPEAMLFGPNGTARQAFSQWQSKELLKGQHRGNSRPAGEKMAEAFDRAVANTHRLPQSKNKNGDIEQIDIAADKGRLPEGIESEISKAFGRESQLYCGKWYKGTRRLSGDLPYQIIEAMAIELMNNRSAFESGSFGACQSELEKVITDANESGQDAFFALYNHSGRSNALKEVWGQARKILNDYAEHLWKKRDNYGEQMVARKRQELLGTVYLNNGRYYWIPKQGEKAVPLVPDKDKNKLPGSLRRNEPGGYMWWIPHLKFRRRMVPSGQKVATKDLKTAKKLQRKEWERIQQYEPELAATLRGMRKWGVATKHKPTAVRIAKKLWREMQESDPQAVARIISDKRPERTKPDMATVWPSWTEEKARLAGAKSKPQMPIVYPAQSLYDEYKFGLCVPAKLETLVDKIRKVDWMVSDAMLVFDNDSPTAPESIAIQSKGKEWTDVQRRNGSRFSIQGSTSIDKDTGRIRFTVYSPGSNNAQVLTEEVYHIVYELIRKASPRTFKAIQKWYGKEAKAGADSTIPTGEAFAKAMAIEENDSPSNLPRSVIKYAQKVFSEKKIVHPSTLRNVKSNLSVPQISANSYCR